MKTHLLKCFAEEDERRAEGFLQYPSMAGQKDCKGSVFIVEAEEGQEKKIKKGGGGVLNFCYKLNFAIFA